MVLWVEMLLVLGFLPNIKGVVFNRVAANSQSRVPLSWITNQIEELNF